MPSTLTRRRLAVAQYDTAALFAAPADTAERTDLITTRALLFYEGRHTSMSGSTRAYSQKDLEAIQTATNAWLAKGRRVKLYLSDADHQQISQGAVAGYLVGQLALQQITAADLPLPGLEDLVGLWGLFSTVQIAGADACAQYLDGRLKELSIGLTPDNVILEVSAVAISALAGAALFAGVAAAAPYALTLADTQRELTEGRDLWELWEQFLATLNNVMNASPEDLGDRDSQTLRAQLVEDFSRQLANRLQVSITPLPNFAMPQELNPANPTPPSAAETTPAEPDRFAALEGQLQKLQEENARLTSQIAVSARFNALKERAIALRDKGIITPAKFDQFFAPAKLETYAAPGNTELDRIEFWLDQESERPPAAFGMPVYQPITNEEATSTADEFLNSYQPKTIY